MNILDELYRREPGLKEMELSKKLIKMDMEMVQDCEFYNTVFPTPYQLGSRYFSS